MVAERFKLNQILLASFMLASLLLSSQIVHAKTVCLGGFTQTSEPSGRFVFDLRERRLVELIAKVAVHSEIAKDEVIEENSVSNDSIESRELSMIELRQRVNFALRYRAIQQKQVAVDALAQLTKIPESKRALISLVSELERNKNEYSFYRSLEKMLRKALERQDPIAIFPAHFASVGRDIGSHQLSSETLVGLNMNQVEKEYSVLSRRTSPNYSSYLAKKSAWRSIRHEVDLAMTEEYFGIANDLVGTDSDGSLVRARLGAKFFSVRWKDIFDFTSKHMIRDVSDHRFYAILFPKKFIQQNGLLHKSTNPSRFFTATSRNLLRAHPSKAFVIDQDGPRLQVTVLSDSTRFNVNGQFMTHADYFRSHALAVVEFDRQGRIIRARVRESRRE